MTRDEVLAMKPGRELDARVAEKVMGWTYGHPCPEGMDCLHWVDEKGEVRDHKPPQYSTDISAAWEVLEKFFWVQVTANPPHIWKATVITSPAKGSVAATAKGFTAPEAICKAALLAVMGK